MREEVLVNIEKSVADGGDSNLMIKITIMEVHKKLTESHPSCVP
jgi:hypothetical protein